jgi:predicted component of type VI protein secretion system
LYQDRIAMDFQLVVLRGRSATTALKLGDGVTTAGRHDDCQLRIKSSEVSRRHCQFFEKNGLLLVKDLGSSNGTMLNGKKIEGQRVLEPGDELTIGPVKLRVEKIGQAPAAAKVAPQTAAPKPGDTAIPAPTVTPGAASDEFEIDFDDGLDPLPEDQTVAVKPQATPAQAAAPAPAPSKKVDQTELPTTEAPIEDDAIADFLLDLKIDDEE